jgi:hypothetical protein
MADVLTASEQPPIKQLVAVLTSAVTAMYRSKPSLRLQRHFARQNTRLAQMTLALDKLRVLVEVCKRTRVF